MARISLFLRETLDLFLVYLVLIAIALPAMTVLHMILGPRGFLFGAAALGTAEALFVMPQVERKIRVFSKTKPAQAHRPSIVFVPVRGVTPVTSEIKVTTAYGGTQIHVAIWTAPGSEASHRPKQATLLAEHSPEHGLFGVRETAERAL